VTARLVVAATQSGAGKTTVSVGLSAALATHGHRVAAFKVGPDFIDPSYHAIATGRPARNLDAFMSGAELIAPLFVHGAAGCDVAVIEGVLGLFDGKSGAGDLASTAHVAKLLRAPVLLVVDAKGMGRSVAALVRGFAGFDPDLRVAGVILNRVASDRHDAILRDALASEGVRVLGTLRRHVDLATPERHLGLVPAAERVASARATVNDLGDAIACACDLAEIVALARTAPALGAAPWDPSPDGPLPHKVRVAVASGLAFSFLYTENLEMLRGRGADILLFDPATVERLPEATDVLYVGGGFPEVYADVLSANEPLRSAVRAFALSGRPVLAECGGLLYLCRTMDGHPMCGVLEADASMTDRLTLGYREATAARSSVVAAAGFRVRGHEFHYSTTDPEAGERPAWFVDGAPAGFLARGTHASYLHTHWPATPEIPDRLLREAAEAAA
jgi:cobyrinic acid a,c-diamide synthase